MRSHGSSILASPILWEDEDLTALSLYYSELQSCIPFPTKQQEWEAGLEAAKGNELAQHELVVRNLRFAYSYARRYQYTGLELEDLVAEANAGLLEAIGRFEPKKNVKFISYAHWWIKAHIHRAIPTLVFPVSIPNYKYETSYRRNSAYLKKRARRLAPPVESDPYLRETDSLQFSDALRFYRFISPPIKISSLHCSGFEITQTKSGYHTVDNRQTADLLESDRNEKLFSAMKSVLTARELDIIVRYYGFRADQETLRVIGKSYDLSRERIRQLKERALDKLRENSLVKVIRECYWPVRENDQDDSE